MRVLIRLNSRLPWSAYILLAATLVCIAPRIAAQQIPPDNTKKNQSAGMTADQQKNNSSDIEITRRIRRLIINDKALSTYAHNIKVITRGGRVTLKGPVNSRKEKEVITAKASEVAGHGNVTDEMRVVSKQSEQ
ncbi:MAG TPA: BON domain-containing protein [Candidatus Acidoferrales bacterium]|nr:BON domain-containing protein [Candidatus Acidoferrales bacterium]